MSERIAVIGAGAVGCYFGGMLARAGRAVTLVGRPAHVDAIARDGLRIESAAFDERIAVRASARPSDAADADVVLLCVKTPDTESAAREIAPHVRPHAVVASLQNGVDNARRVRGILANPVLAAVVYVGAGMAGPGHVRHTGRGELRIGPLAAERTADTMAGAHSIARLFSGSGIPCEVANDVEAELWTKLVLNAVFNAISALGTSNYEKMMATPPIRALVPDIVGEVVAVARADGVQLDPGALLADCLRIAQTMPHQISSTAQDVLRGKPTEIDALNGFVAERARAHGIAAPINRVLHALVKLRESA